MRRGSESSLPQSATEWNLKSPTSANMPRCTPAMAAGGGLFDNGCLAAKSRVAGAFRRVEVPFFGTKF